MMLDLAVQNGRIYDPETKSTRIGSIGIENGRIACIESHALTAKTEIWAEQADVVPGFIDIHMHEGSLINGIIDATIGRAMIHMGVTTVVGGNCGYSPDSIKAYFTAVQKAGSPVNVALLYGYNGIRRSLCEANGAMEFRGDDVYLHFSRDEIAKLEAPIRRAMEEGAIGLSYGLEYAPGCTTEEIIQTGLLLRDYDHTLIAAHYRYDAERCLDSVREAIDVCAATRIPFQFSHIGSCSAFRGSESMEKALKLLEDAHADGVDIMADCYPYTAFSALIGTTVFDEGCFERWGADYSSLMVAEGPFRNQFCTPELFYKLRETAPNTRIIGFVMSEEGVDYALRHPMVMVGSDGRFANGFGHPRGAGTFSRVLSRYVREKQLLTFEQAIDKMTIMPAERLHLRKKGRIQEGCDADIVILDRNLIRDGATFSDPLLSSEGIHAVIVNGEVCLRHGRYTANAGRPIRRQEI